jgi:hypothetical protein
MQISDAFIWYRRQNGLSSKFIVKHVVPFILSCELLAAYLGYVYYSGKRLSLLYEIPLVTFILLLTFFWHLLCHNENVGEDGYLQWCGKESPTPFLFSLRSIFLLLLFYPSMYFPDLFMKIIVCGGGLVLWLQLLNSSSFGSRWCHSFYVIDLAILAKLAIEGI